MGKAQSKRSVDITTDPKKDGTVDEGTGEMKKIEDVDQLKPQVNGDTHHNENEDKEKVAENGETENEKDLSTEKENQKPQEGATATVATTPDPGAGGDTATAPISTPTNNENTTATTANIEQSDANETLNDSKTAESATSATETPDSSKKPKKEKVKKKWSFRSISFGKKDKQKPSKKEDAAAANTSTVNGECEKVPEETTTEETKTTEENKEVEPSKTETTAAVPTEETKNSVEESKPANVDTEVKAENVETTNVATTEIKSDEVVTNGSTETETVTETKIIESVKSTDEESASPPPQSVPEQKEQQQQSTIENVPTVNHTPVVVETEKPHEETLTSASLTNGIEHHDVKESKLNGSAESPKIEVKSEENKSSVVDVEQNSKIEPINEKEIILSSETEKSINVVQISTNISNNIVAKDDDNNDPINSVNKLNSSLPPPLPCSPPPSQVMVFALSETKQEQQPILEEIVKSENINIKNTSENLVEKLQIVTGNISDAAENLIKDKVEEIVEKVEKSSDICEVPVIVEESDKKNNLETTSNNSELTLEKTTNENDQIQNSTQICNASTEVIAANIVEEKLIATEQELLSKTSEKQQIENVTAAFLTENKNEINEQLDSVEQEIAVNIEKQSEILIEKEKSIEKIVEENKLELNEETTAAAIDRITNEEISNLLSNNKELHKEIETKIPEINIDTKSQDDNNDQLDNNTSPANEIIKQEDTMSTAIFDNNINEIVETIALIEEFTDTVASDSKDLMECFTSIVNDDNDVPITKIEENQASQPPPTTTTTTTTIIPEENKIVENSIEQKEEETSINEENLPTPPPSPTSQITTTTIESEENIIRENKSDIDKITEEESTVTSSDNINSSVTESKSDKSESDECSSEITTSTSQNVQQDNDITATATNNAPTNQNKENGVEGNHEELAEVSATESLNGVDHKTIENIKSENQQIEKVGTEVIAQGAAAAVAE